MAILWDAPLASAVAGELSTRLGGGRLRAFFLDQPARNLLLFFREETLVFRLHPLRGEVTLHPAVEALPEEARPLQAKLRAVIAPPDERLLVFRLTPVRSGRDPMEIVVELLPNRWNAVVVEARSRTIRHVLLPSEPRAAGRKESGRREGGRPESGSSERGRPGSERPDSGGRASRELLSGVKYREPAPSTREGADGSLSLERWLEILLPVEAGERKRALLRNVAYSASLNVPALLGETGVGGAPGPGAAGADSEEDPCGEAGAEGPSGEEAGATAANAGAHDEEVALARGWKLWNALASGPAHPCLLETPKGPHPYPIPLPHLGSKPYDSLLESFEATLAAEHQASEAALVPSELLGRLEEGVRDAEKRVLQLEAELERAPDPEPIRAVGDLILARFAEIPKGRRSVELTGFDGEPVEIELDPALPPHENAARYYDEAARAVRARERVPKLIRKAEARAAELTALLERVRSAGGIRSGRASSGGTGSTGGGAVGTGGRGGTGGTGSTADTADTVDTEDNDTADVPPLDLGELRKIIEARVPRRRSQKGRKGGAQQEGPLLPYHVFRSSGGLEIRVGRGARANDDLTFHHSSPDDIWLHARQVGGAHVILRWSSDDNPPARDLYEAGVLAALNSKARTSGSAPVDWTRRKYVRKPRKSPPGAVLPTRVSTLFVEPDPAVGRRLAVE